MTWHDGEREVLGFWACSFVLKNIRTITDWHSRLQRDKLQREACVRIGASPRGTKVSEASKGGTLAHGGSGRRVGGAEQVAAAAQVDICDAAAHARERQLSNEAQKTGAGGNDCVE